jgi:hypothetical protein
MSSPALVDVNPNTPGIMVDPYPSPPKSLDSPPPELNDLIQSIGVSNSSDSNITQKIWNRKGLIQQETNRQLNAILVR